MQYRNGRNRSGDQGGFAIKQERKGMEKRGFVVTDDEDIEEEEEKDKVYMNFKGLIDSDEEDEDEDEDEGEEVEVADELFEKGSSFSLSPQSASGNSYLSESRFDQCPISPLSLKAIKDAGYEKMTLVQEATLPLPAIELIVKSPPVARDQKRPPILVLVICPTRELASQAAAEANTLLKYHPSIFVIGGTRLALEQKRMQANPCQILVFCTTAMVTRLVAELLGELNLNVREIHSRKPQGYRTRISDEFRKSKGLILVTSDVSARGVDYPDVTLVIQGVGNGGLSDPPADGLRSNSTSQLTTLVSQLIDSSIYIDLVELDEKEKKDKAFCCWHLGKFFLSSIKDLPISKAPEPLVDPETRKKVERALAHVEMKNKEAAYQAWLGYYNSNKNVGRDKYRLVELANEFSHSMGLDNLQPFQSWSLQNGPEEYTWIEV
ncbi:UNVERIFIED_CONTAM: DEAD-box ATP-dependent RNA helicase 31 [Sesamum calycinum]|uniref:ATP-dependent RNA helicase n=1 Tax=Sesamum calycinum TaxID=2727403 RepID=A0AAW2T083_9LAMI